MPHPKGHLKLSGDIHPPELDDFDAAIGFEEPVRAAPPERSLTPAVITSRKIRSPFWKEPHRHPVLKWLGIAAGAMLVYRLVLR